MTGTINMNTDLMNGFLNEITDILQDLGKAYNAIVNLQEGFAEETGTVYQGQGSESLSAYMTSMEMHITLLIELVSVLSAYIESYQDIMETVDQETAAEIAVTGTH